MSFERLQAVFLAARELPPAEREAFLARECGGDARLRSMVDGMLAGEGVDPAFLGAAAVAGGFNVADHARAGTDETATAGDAATGERARPTIDGYDVLRKLGEGGMGVVWLAVQRSTKREVALKVMIAAGLGSDRAVRRFQREVDLTARLEHPGIARVYDGGAAGGGGAGGTGVCYYAMERIDGVPLDAYVARAALPRRRVIELVRAVAEAVQFAHQNGVIHRDLKPSNVLVDGRGAPHVLDFGLAKAVEAAAAAGAGEGAAATAVSVEGAVAGTPAYMSPEQAAGLNARTDTRSDVYSLGVILFHLLTGRFPHDTSGSFVQVFRRIVEDEPARLSAVDPRRSDRDLDALLDKALARDPGRRYATAGEFAADLGRYLRGDPLVARPPTVRYLLAKKLRRHRAAVAVGATVLLVLAGVAVAAYVRVDAARATAQAAYARADASAVSERAARAQAEARLTQSLLARGDAAVAARRGAEAVASYAEARDRLAGAGEPTLIAELGLWAAHDSSPTPVWSRPLAVVSRCVALSAWLGVTGHDDGTVHTWDVRKGIELGRLPPHRGPVSCVAFSPDGRTVLSSGGDGVIRLAPLLGGAPPVELVGHAGNVQSAAFAARGDLVLSGGADKRVLLWDVKSAAVVRSFEDGAQAAVDAVAISADGKVAASASHDGTLRVWDATDGHRLHAIPRAGVTWSLAFGPSGHQLLSGGADGMRLWDADTGAVVRHFHGHSATVRWVAFGRDGRTAVSGSWDKRVKVWDVATARELRTFSGHGDSVHCVAVSADGQAAVSVGGDKALVCWSAGAAGEVVQLAGHKSSAVAAAVSPDGRLIASAGTDVRVWDRASGQLVEAVAVDGGGFVHCVGFTPDGRTLVYGGDGRTLYAHAIGSADPPRAVGAEAGVIRGLGLLPDGRTAACVTAAGDLGLWDVDTGRRVRSSHVADVALRAIGLIPGGRRAVLCGADGIARVWDLEGGGEVWRFRADPLDARAVAVLGDGGRALIGGINSELYAWNLADGARTAELSGPTAFLYGVAASRDGRTALSVTGDQMLRAWDVDARTELRAFPVENGAAVTCTPDGLCAVVPRLTGSVAVWDFARPAEYERLAPAAASAAAALARDRKDAAALVEWSTWLGFRGLYAWQADMLEEARKQGAAVPPLALGRCYWRQRQFDRAAAEFELAAADASDPAEKAYLQTCHDAIARQATGR